MLPLAIAAGLGHIPRMFPHPNGRRVPGRFAAGRLWLAVLLCAGAPAARAVSYNDDGLAAKIGGRDGETRDEFLWTAFELSMRDRPHGQSAYAPDQRALQALHPAANLLKTDRDPLDVVLRRTRVLLEDVRPAVAGALDAEAQALDALDAAAAGVAPEDAAARFALFEQAAALRRRIAFRNPVLQGLSRILFIQREAFPAEEMRGSHMCDQYFGFHATQGGTTRGDGLYVLEDAFSDRPYVRNLLADRVVEQGRLQGRPLEGGGFLSPEVSFDGQTLLFAYTEGEHQRRYVWNERTTFHLFTCKADGSGLVQLTDGPVNDFDPAFLPNGRIVFISERRGGFGRCHGRPVPSFTLHSMRPDGTDLVCLSPHETNEWQPSVDNNGMIVYTRWDYVDRGFNQAHQAWITYPDGRDARALSANTRTQANNAPQMQMDVRAIPGATGYVAVAAPHHGEARGSLIFIDPRRPDDDAMSTMKRITPDQLFPEAEFGQSRGSSSYASPWPLASHYYLCVYDRRANAQYGDLTGEQMKARRYGLYLVDAFGNKILLHRNPEISCLSPIPLHPRRTPPVIAHATPKGPPVVGATRVAAEPVPATARVGLMNVYDSIRPLPEGTKITHLRIWQLFPKQANAGADHPKLGAGAQKGSKAALGIVPVEADGSAYWIQPANVPVLYHAIDANGVAVQGMRSAAYAQPGEHQMCSGCHDWRQKAPVMKSVPLALRRAPSVIQPEFDGTNPFNYPRLVQPVLDRNCVRCHDGTTEPGKSFDLRPGEFEKNPNFHYASFNNLRRHIFFFDDAVFTEANTLPGKFGARRSRLYELLVKGHHDVKLPPEDLRRLVIWMDSNGLFYGHDGDIRRQAEGLCVPPPME